MGINNISISSFDSFSKGKIRPALEASDNSRTISVALMFPKISIRKEDLNPILIGSPSNWQLMVSSAEMEKSIS